MAWRLAKSLETLRTQLNEAYPDRRKSSDGTIGDESHASKTSDHNPWVKDGAMGVVTAIDFTHDPERGVDSDKLAHALIDSKDTRIKYVISRGKICSSETSPWVWRKYTGSNPHNKHMHLSVKSNKKLYDDASSWSANFPVVKPPGNKDIVAARAIGIGSAATAAVGQVADVVSPPTIQSVQTNVSAAGNIVSTTKEIVKTVPETFWSKLLAMVQTPEFLAAALGVTIVAWVSTWLLRAYKNA
jgi:hypothetical protein